MEKYLFTPRVRLIFWIKYSKIALMLKVKSVKKGGVGYEIGIRGGDEILAFDNFPVVDILDYLYYDDKERFTITVRQSNGDVSTCEIEKDDDETLDLTFVSDNLEIRTCRNNCVFCFVDQMPVGMRESLYLKDDDYRQSFLCGNFVTLTNITEEDAERIIRLNLSPLYISIHTMNGELRKQMLRNRFADKTIEYVKRFAKSGITMNTQIVLVPDYNDGKELEYSAKELFALYPAVQTMAVVPVGLTKYRDGLTPLKNLDKNYAISVLTQISALNKEFKTNFIQPADEFYFKAELPVEPYAFYGSFPQIENGVGMTAKFLKELKSAVKPAVFNKRLLLVCGTSAERFIESMTKLAASYIEGLTARVMAVENEFFGKTVNCTGLLTGGDIAAAAIKYAEKHGYDYDYLVLPANTLRQGTEIFLDDMTVSQLSEKIGKEVLITDGTGKGFYDVLAGKGVKNG